MILSCEPEEGLEWNDDWESMNMDGSANYPCPAVMDRTAFSGAAALDLERDPLDVMIWAHMVSVHVFPILKDHTLQHEALPLAQDLLPLLIPEIFGPESEHKVTDEVVLEIHQAHVMWSWIA